MGPRIASVSTMMRSRPDVAIRGLRTRRRVAVPQRGGLGVIVGQCATCDVRFAARLEHRDDVRYLLTVHAELCPGGRRAGEVVWPLTD
jgi:hypothetical protein